MSVQRATATGDADLLLRQAVLTHQLPVAQVPSDGLNAAFADPDAMHRTTRWAIGERLDGLWVGVVASSGSVDDSVLAVHRACQVVSLGCEATAVQVTETLRAAGVEMLLAKGIAAANLDYADPAQRSTADVDALVCREQLIDAVQALEAAGYRRGRPALRSGWERRFARTVVLLSPYGVEVDLHAALATGYFGRRLPMHTVWDQRDRIELGGVECWAASPVVRLLWACYAAGLNRGTSQRYLRDAAQLLLIGEVDWMAAVSLAESGDGTAVMAAAAQAAVRCGMLPTQHPFALWSAQAKPSRRAARALRLADIGTTQGWLADARSTMLALGLIDKVRFLAEFAVPSPQRRRAERRSPWERLRRLGRFARMRG